MVSVEACKLGVDVGSHGARARYPVSGHRASGRNPKRRASRLEVGPGSRYNRHPVRDLIKMRSTASNEVVKFVGGIGGFFAAILVAIPIGKTMDLSSVTSAALLGAMFVLLWVAIALAVWLLWRGAYRLVVGRNAIECSDRGVVRWLMRRGKVIAWSDVVAVEVRDVIEKSRGLAESPNAPLAMRLAKSMAARHWVIAFQSSDNEIEIRSPDLVNPSHAHQVLARWCSQALGIDLGDLRDFRTIVPS